MDEKVLVGLLQEYHAINILIVSLRERAARIKEKIKEAARNDESGKDAAQ